MSENELPILSITDLLKALTTFDFNAFSQFLAIPQSVNDAFKALSQNVTTEMTSILASSLNIVNMSSAGFADIMSTFSQGFQSVAETLGTNIGAQISGAGAGPFGITF